MTKYFVSFLLLATLVYQGYSTEEIWLDERNVDYISHDYLGTSISIPKFLFDTLITCQVIFPNGAMYEAYPNDNIPHSNIFFMEAVEPFVSCAVGFRGVGVEASGTYELLSYVKHVVDNSFTLTRQRFNLNVTVSDFTK
ncbi:unnamed protein product [Parnassius apollo]|uniref:(apollo) hypothetical protein n=1 Tax=Parnassius apollo TaxID=110799 RepID=A0A8S3WTB9_PARAO|nr:unnamed protein product [Parnassius apollo]